MKKTGVVGIIFMLIFSLFSPTALAQESSKRIPGELQAPLNINPERFLSEKDTPFSMDILEKVDITSVFKEWNYNEPVSTQSMKIKDMEQIRKSYTKQHRLATIQSSNVTHLSEVNNRQIVLKLNPGSSIDWGDFGVEPIDTSSSMEKRGLFLVQVPVKVDFEKKLDELKQNSNVLHAEPDFIYEGAFVPNDADYEKQWYLKWSRHGTLRRALLM